MSCSGRVVDVARRIGAPAGAARFIPAGVEMKIHEATIENRSGTFALPPLPETVVDTFNVMRLHVRANGAVVLWRRDGQECDDETSYRIDPGATRSIDEPDSISQLRFRLEQGASLSLVYEGLKKNGWFTAGPREMTHEEFIAPILAAQRGNEQLRTKDCVDLVAQSVPHARGVSESSQACAAPDVAVPDGMDADGVQRVQRAANVVAAVTGSNGARNA